MDVAAKIERARALLAQGELKKAAYELTDAASATRDTDAAREIRQLADQGMALAGRFSKGQWKEVQRLADLRIDSASVR